MDLIADFDLTRENTLGLVSAARLAARINAADDLDALVDEARERDMPLKILGGGSNVVLSETVEALVGLMKIEGRNQADQTATHNIVTAGAGENWHEFVAWTVESGMPGLENLAGIPGTVGAAPVQNIGAYGAQLSDFFQRLEAYDTETRQTRVFTREECGFGYRQSRFKAEPDRHVILSLTLALPRDWRPSNVYAGLERLSAGALPGEVMAHVLALRRSKLPDWRRLGNAGSFFHNPVVSAAQAENFADAPRYPQPDGSVKLSAGWLIEQCGLKGERLGPVGTFEGHALVLVNHGGATRRDVIRFAAFVREQVSTRFGVDLVQEPIEI
ncbi:UDP-N-acetylmuramate dehydrogenase [Martelella radicis]|uniref:UDP-N-acetylenolpyruvoylglucosamine reductase n=1 Tax=Martelella radicis TaxID=1397476 RepID=A0A7W6KFJ7_9HYPH|nr:UDP-N-acetylmuramate dehydrogenase [Martelella radicis]MBB4120286.1 UDP-N-acetylmuramate dehydrogenase [Martelella radicis]